LVLRFAQRFLSSRSPAARARIVRGLVLFPALLTLSVMVAALAPSFGWIADHCQRVHEVHAHPHICSQHDAVLLAWPVAMLALLLVLRVAAVTARVVSSCLALVRARRALQSAAKRGACGEIAVLPLDRPQAFVLGILAPRIFITRGLLHPRHRHHLDAVLAHERAHLSRGDSRWRLVGQLAYSFHLPFVARRLDVSLAGAHEMAADDAAARAIGSRSRVAEALVHMARVESNSPLLATAFARTDVESRVVQLLDSKPGAHEPTTSTLLAFAVLGLTGIALAAEGVHHGLEVVMGFFTG
jgi:Zn-dependent protease with chaperone function